MHVLPRVDGPAHVHLRVHADLLSALGVVRGLQLRGGQDRALDAARQEEPFGEGGVSVYGGCVIHSVRAFEVELWVG